MKKHPLVTVLMTVYNGGRYLRSSVPSVINQTFRDFEFLIVNDCSTDDSVNIIQSFNDERIIVHNNENNMGQTKSLNVGLKLARGKYVARMDADDVAFPLWLEKLTRFISSHPEYDVVGPGAVVIDAESEITNIIISPDNNEKILLSIFCDTPINHVGSIMNKEVIIKLGSYNELFMIKQDYELWSSMMRKNRKITSIPDLLVAVRVHEQSLTSIESDKGLNEYARTVYENIKQLTNLKITPDDALNLARLRLKPYSLNTNEFYQAINVFIRIYEKLKSVKNKEIQSKYLRQQVIKSHCKRALEEVAFHQIRQGRNTSWRCLKNYGFHPVPLAIYISSFMGVRGVNWTSGVYKKILQLKANRQMNTQHIPSEILKSKYV